MLISLFLLALLLGILAGTITGLTPGIHINLVAAILLSMTSLQQNITFFIVLVTAMAITHTFIDFIPSIFLGAPDEENALSVLPGHELLLKGHGHHAVKLTLVGSVIAVFLFIPLSLLIIFFVPKIYPFINRMLGFFLIWIVILLVYSERKSKLKAVLIFTLSAFLGFAVLNLELSDPLLPLFSGLFGASIIIFSIKQKTKIPLQKKERIPIFKKDIIKPTIASILVSPICALFPGLGSSQAAVIGSEITGKLDREQFLILIGSVNTLILSLSFVVLFTIQKNRTGIAAAISEITTLSNSNLILIFATIILSTIILVPLILFLSKIFSKYILKINYQKLSFAVLTLIIIIVIFFSGALGFFVFVASTILGLTCTEFEVRKSFLMGSLMMPTIIYYLPI